MSQHISQVFLFPITGKALRRLFLSPQS